MSSSASGTQLHASQDFWEVEEILKETAYRYLVKWVGLDPETKKPWPDSWVAKEDCTKELIAEWKKKQKEKKRKSKSKGSGAFRTTGPRNVAASKSRSASRTSRTNSPVKKPLSPKSPTPIVQIPRLEKRKQLSSDDNTTDSDEEEQPPKRRKTIELEFDNQSPTTIRVGPPGRAVNYVVNVNHRSNEPVVTYKKVGARKRVLAIVSEPDDSSRGSSPVRRTSSSQSDKSVEDDEVDDDRLSPQSPSPPQSPPVSFKKPPSKNGFTQEIVEETQLYDSSSSSQSAHHLKPNRNDNEGPVVLKQSPKRSSIIPPSPIQSRHTSQSPIQTFDSSMKPSPSRSKQKRPMHPEESDDIDSEDAPQIRRQESDTPDPRLFEKQEEEESQSQPREGGSVSASQRQSTATTPSSINPTDVIEDMRKFKSSKSALISVFARLGKVFGGMEPDDIESHNSRVGRTKERSLSPDVDEHENPDPLPHIEYKKDEDSLEMDQIRDSGDHPYVPDADADVDELDADAGDDDELGPDDAADNITSSVPESLQHPIHSSLLVNAATTQRTLQPVIESPVRQLDSALGLLHRKSEEIQMLRDQVVQLQEAVGNSERRIHDLKKELDRSEEHREAQGLQVAQLEIELVSTKSEVAVNAVQTALNPQEPSSSKEDSAIVDASELDLTLIQLQDEIERHKLKIADLERENNVFRNLYTQASATHLNNLEELKDLKRDNASLRQQATSGVQQANLFWKTQVATLEKKLKQAKGETQLMIHQNRATQNIRDRAALYSIAQKEMVEVQRELDEWKDRINKLGMENTELRIELKRRDDEDLTRRRKQREVDELNKRALEADGDQLLYICPWRDDRYEKCGGLFDSRESLREHFYQAGHL